MPASFAPYRKAVAAVVGATILVVQLLPGGVTNAEWVIILTAYASALGVYAAPNED